MATGKIPVDFEKKVKQAASPNGLGSPVQISARDLMENYNYLLGLIQTIPDGETVGDLLYWSGSEWAILPAPTTDAGLKLLGFTNGALAWTDTEECP